MRTGLFKSIYGKPGVGIFPELFNLRGSSPIIQSQNIRLGGLGVSSLIQDSNKALVIGMCLGALAGFLVGSKKIKF